MKYDEIKGRLLEAANGNAEQALDLAVIALVETDHLLSAGFVRAMPHRVPELKERPEPL